MSDDENRESVAIILHSGAYDRAAYVLTIALVSLASGMDVHMLATYEGLKRFTKGHLADLDEETSRIVRTSIQRGLASGGIPTMESQLTDAKKMGLKIYACPNAMAALNITFTDLIEEVDDIMGLAGFLGLARQAKIHWYI